MTWDRCCIDAARSTPPGELVFHRLNWEQTDDLDYAWVEEGSEYVATEPPGEVVGVWHPDGDEEAQLWIANNCVALATAGFTAEQMEQWLDNPPWRGLRPTA